MKYTLHTIIFSKFKCILCPAISSPSQQRHRTFPTSQKVFWATSAINSLPWPPGIWPPLICFLSVDAIVSPFLEFYINGIIWVVVFFIWLLWLSIIVLRNIYTVAYIIFHSFLLPSIILLNGYSIIYLFTSWRAFLDLTVTNKTALNIQQDCVNIHFHFSWVGTQ